MSAEQVNPTHVTEPQWRVVDAEHRVNVIRTSAIAVFYLVHLWHVSAPGLGEQAATIIGFDAKTAISPNVHIAITVLCLAWLMQAFAIHFFIQRRQISDRLVTLETLGDIALLTAILCLSTGPVSPMISGYFLIIMMTGLRFNLRLVRIATVASVVGYLVVLGAARWPIALLNDVKVETVPRYHQLMIVLAMVFSGVITGQIIRHGYAIANDIRQNSRGNSP